jgi:hypothetical protein
MLKVNSEAIQDGPTHRLVTDFWTGTFFPYVESTMR